MSTNRLSRGGSLFGTDPQVQLRIALRTNDFPTFKKLVNIGAVDLEYVYPYPDYKTCLELAVSEPNKQDFVKLLLQYEAQVNNINETYGAAPIHLAVENGNKDALSLLLEDDRIDVNIKCKGNTALLMAIKQIQDLDDDREHEMEVHEIMIEMLLKAGSDVNSPDLKGITPIYSASKQGLERIITYIIDYSREPIDIDTYKDIRGKTARYFLQEAFPHLISRFKLSTENTEVVTVDKLFSYLSRHDEDKFVHDFGRLVKKNEHRPILASNNGMNTMLQLATDKGFEKVVSILLNSGADPNATCSGNTSRPVALACTNGYHKILRMYIDNESTLFEPYNDESLLLITVRNMKLPVTDSKVNFRECLDLLLSVDDMKKHINHTDKKDNTALHYAARNGDHETVLYLLRKGACIGLRNKFDIPPLADINAKTLESYLDECVETNGERPSDDGYEIRFKYSFLVHPNNSMENELWEVPLMNKSNNNNDVKEYGAILAPETEALLYMTSNEELRPLLTHPVITSFLYLKWQRISCLFNANITFYSLFCLCLNLYIIFGYGVEYKQTKSVEALNIVTHIGASIGLIVLLLRELFQLLVSPTRYLQSIENWLEIALIIVTAWIVCYDSAQESTKQQLSAVAILLSSAELVLLIGQYPTLSTNIVMLRTVSWNFFKFLLWYCILIIAFALSFYTLFRKDIKEDQVAPNPNNAGQDEDGDEDFFEDPGRSLFKTIVMLTGEFDAGSIKFSTFPVTSHIIFVVFVFMIPIVLFNLLNGLAVSDTQEIRADAELVGHVSRIKLISYFESVLIGKVYTKPMTCWSWIPTDLNIIRPQRLCIKPFARRISLFPFFLPKYKIVVKPNQDNRIEIPQPEPREKYGDDEDIESGKCCFERCHAYRLDRKIVKHAKIILSKRAHISEFDEIKNKLESLENILKKVLQKTESPKK